jgi:hypothetical protein
MKLAKLHYKDWGRCITFRECFFGGHTATMTVDYAKEDMSGGRHHKYIMIGWKKLYRYRDDRCWRGGEP